MEKCLLHHNLSLAAHFPSCLIYIYNMRESLWPVHVSRGQIAAVCLCETWGLITAYADVFYSFLAALDSNKHRLLSPNTGWHQAITLYSPCFTCLLEQSGYVPDWNVFQLDPLMRWIRAEINNLTCGRLFIILLRARELIPFSFLYIKHDATAMSLA